MELHGVTGAPYKHPEVRRKIPAAHQRERIDLDGGRRVKRDWKDIALPDIRPGDTIAGFGTVAHICETVNVSKKFALMAADGSSEYEFPDSGPLWRIRVTNVAGEHRDFPGEQRVFAFCQGKK